MPHRPVILLVEDEPLVRMFNADILDDAGYRIIEAGSGDEALTLYQARPHIRAVVTDVEMPGSLDGMGLAKRVAELRPFVGALIVSGRARPADADLPDDALFLAKPYMPEELLSALEQVMAVHDAKRPSPDEPGHSRSR
jgi:CheY-like chemotaxis protein